MAVFKSFEFSRKARQRSRTYETILRYVWLVNPSLCHQWKQAGYWQVKQNGGSITYMPDAWGAGQ